MSDKFEKFMNAVKEGNLEEVKLYFDKEFINKANEDGYNAIHLAARNGYVNILEVLLQNNCDKEATDNDGYKAIHYAAQYGHVNILEVLLSNKCDIETPNNIYGWKAIHAATQYGHANILQMLFKNNCEKEAVDKDGWKAIHLAAQNGHVNILQILLENNCNKEATTKDGWKAIHFAAQNGHVNILQMLLNNHCDKEATDNYGFKAVHHAARNGHADILKVLFNHNCDIESFTKFKDTPLKLATIYYKNDCVTFLTKSLETQETIKEIEKVLKGSKVNEIMDIIKKYSLSIIINNKTKITFLEELLNMNNKDIIEELKKKILTEEDIEEWRDSKTKMTPQSYKLIEEWMLYRCIQQDNEAQFDMLNTPDIINKDSLFLGPSVLETFADCGKEKYVIKFLSNLEQIDKTWTRAIEIAKSKRYENIISMISNSQNTKNGYNQLHIAVVNNDLQMVEYILENKYVDLEEEDKYGRTAVHLAVYGDNINILQKLLDYGCDKEATDKNGMKAIHRAAEKGQVDILQILIDRECDIESYTNDSETPLDLAEKNNKEDCVLLLKKSLKNMNKSKIKKEKEFIIKVPELKNGMLIGQGAFGKVYKYIDPETRLTFAVKQVSFSTSQNIKKQVKDFDEEIKIYTKLESHSKIVHYFGCISDRNALYIFMEYMNGGSLREYLDKNGPLIPSKIALYSKQILEGLDFLHKNNIIHRDIKGDNILRDDKDNIKLCDFGISKNIGNMSSAGSLLFTAKTQTEDLTVNTTCGTPYWMAPEVINGEFYSVLADVWSLGATVVEMLTGFHPYPNLFPYQAAVRIATTGRIDYKCSQPLPSELKIFIDRMLTADPKGRATVEELLNSEFILDNSKISEENKEKFNIKIPNLEEEGVLIGKGAYGLVFKYTDPENKQTFAIKKLFIFPTQEIMKQIKEFKKEIIIYSRLKKHSKIVDYFGFSSDTEAMYIFMEYITGGSIKNYLTKNGPLTSSMISWYSKQILEGLQFLHQQNIIHRDIKGENILRDEQENIKICDFGLSKYVGTISVRPANDSDNKNETKLTKTTCGTPYFMAPEVIDGAEYSIWADVWSLGATVIEMLTGDHPYPKLNAFQALFRIKSSRTIEYEPPQTMTKELKTFIDKMISTDPKDRATVEDLFKSEFIINSPKTVEEITERFVKKCIN